MKHINSTTNMSEKNLNKTDSTIYLNYEEFGAPYISFIEAAKIAMKNGDPVQLNSVLDMLSLIKIKEGYMLDSYKYKPNYDRKSYSRKYGFINYIYVRKIDSKRKYSPKLKRSFMEKLKNKTPEEIIFEKTEYQEDMKIKSPLYTKDCIKNIPPTISYLTCPFTTEGIWQLFLYLNFINSRFYSIIFSNKEIEKFNTDDYSSEYIFKEGDYEKVSQMDLTPKIVMNNKSAVLKLAMHHKDIINLYEFNVENKSNTCGVNTKSIKVSQIAKLLDNSRPLIGSISPRIGSLKEDDY